ncbi:MAG: sporulation integral membrane protein YtvI [Bacillota bacterium]|nr:sporulation integral membrane protein YtvI [Bacillota bacterium]
MDPELQQSLKRLVKITILVLALLSIYLLFVYVFPIMGNFLLRLPILILPFAIALILALIVEPVVGFFESNLKMKRNWAVITSLLLVIGGFIYLVSLLVSVIIREVSALYRLVLSHSDQLIDQVMGSMSDIQLFFLRLDIPPQVEGTIQEALKKALLVAQDLMNNLINGLVQIFTILPGLLVFLIIVTIASFFIMKDRAVLSRYISDIFPAQVRIKGKGVIEELLKALTGFLKAYFILISITTIITLVSLKILGVKYILTIGILVGMADILPVLGPGTIFIPWIIWEFISGETAMGVSLIIVYLLISVVRQFLEPKIVGDNIGLHPLGTLISLYVGLQLGGLIGMILGPVIVVIFIAGYRAGIFDRFDWRKKCD